MSLTAAPATRRVVEAEELTPYLGGEDSPHEDGLLTLLLEAATEKVESRCGRALIRREFVEERRLCDWLRIYRMYRAPVVDVESVTVDGELVASTEYEVADDAIYFDPPIFCDSKVRVVYTAGYSDSPSGVPSSIRLAILRAAATWYEHREEAVVGTITSELPAEVNSVLAPFKRHLL